MSGQHPELGLRFSAEHAELHDGLFMARVLTGGLNEVRTESWATTETTLTVDSVVFRHTREGHEVMVFEHEQTLVSVGFFAGHVAATVAGTSREDVSATLASL